MPLVSKRKLQKDIEAKMYETFWEAISKVKSKSEVQGFLSDLLSPVESTMVAKRLAIAALLLRGYGYENIMNLLKVSGATIAKVSAVLNANTGYKIAINKIAMSEATREFWQDIENLLYRLSAPGKTFLPKEIVKAKLRHKRKSLL